jgi:hypothetical protein
MEEDSVFFVPSKCMWMEETFGGVNTGFQNIKTSPGMNDIIFNLELFTNPTLDCSEFDFFNALSSIEYEFIL